MPKLTTLAEIAKQAGDKVLEMQAVVMANGNGEQETKHDGSIVTTADKAANQIVCEGLNQHFPGIAVVSEENPDDLNQKALQADERFDTDPLDNTTGYVKGLKDFSVIIGRIKNGVPVAGVVYFPARKELYFTGDDGKAYLQAGEAEPVKITVRDLPYESPLQAVTGFNEQYIPHLFVVPHDTDKFAGQLRTCKVASGEYDITGINKGQIDGYNCWDLAGAQAVLEAADGMVVGIDGKPVRYEKGNSKVPAHIAGSKAALMAVGLLNEQEMCAAQRQIKLLNILTEYDRQTVR